MTVKELRNIINAYVGLDSAKVYIEIPMGENIYIQKPVENLRIEETSINTYCIIAGNNGGELNI